MEYIKWLEEKIERCLEDKDLQREHWAFCQALSKYRELGLPQQDVGDSQTCKHRYVQKDNNWKSCSHCGMIAPLRQ